VNEQPDNRPPASVEADLFGVLFAFHKKTATLLRESSLDDERKNVVADRIKKLLDDATADMKKPQPINLAARLNAAYEEAERLVYELSQAEHDDKAEKEKPNGRQRNSRPESRLFSKGEP
jgi:uncharacterized membrane protein YukC